MGEYDIGIQLNGEKGAWILASALSYQEMLEELSQYAGLEPRPMLSKMLATPDLSYYRLPRFDDPMADDHYLLCQKCRTFYNGIRGHPPHQCILLEEPFLTR
jgi:hypothetical protein